MNARLTILLGLDFVAMFAAQQRRVGARLLNWPEMRGMFPLHPSLHGDAADHILRDAATDPRPRVVCTHSDVFVLRIRRRIAEGTLSPADVALVWVEADGEERPIPLNDRGTPEWWPSGVFAESTEEYRAIRRALRSRDAGIRAEQPTLPEGAAAS